MLHYCANFALTLFFISCLQGANRRGLPLVPPALLRDVRASLPGRCIWPASRLGPRRSRRRNLGADEAGGKRHDTLINIINVINIINSLCLLLYVLHSLVSTIFAAISSVRVFVYSNIILPTRLQHTAVDGLLTPGGMAMASTTLSCWQDRWTGRNNTPIVINIIYSVRHQRHSIWYALCCTYKFCNPF